MKRFFKVFIVSFSFFFIAMGIGAYSYLRENNIKIKNNIGGGFYENLEIDIELEEKDKNEKQEEEEKEELVEYDNLEEAIERSNRVNFLILGMEDVRTDTIILGSFCEDTKKINLINIPRDTYVHRKGYNRADQRKINSVYASNGVKGIEKAVSHILNDIPIHHHLTIDYKAVENIVDSVGGVEVNVPFKMSYRDPASNPPLVIDIPSGPQTLDGEKALQFIRYRKGINNEGYIDGDIGRIKTQQGFLKSFIDKAMDNRIQIIREGLKHVKTDIGFIAALSYGRKVIGMNEDDVEITILPGKSEFKAINKKVLSYYIYNKEETSKLIENIYNVKQKNKEPKNDK